MRRIVKVGEREVKLSPKEYDLWVLVQHPGKVLTHRVLLKEFWDELTDAQYLRVCVGQLRHKVEIDPERPRFVLTETGIGYRLRAPDQVLILGSRAKWRLEARVARGPMVRSTQVGPAGSSRRRSLPVVRLIKCTLVQALHVTASYSVSETSSFSSSSQN